MLWLLLLAWSIGRGPGGPGQRRQGRPSCGGCRGLEQLGNLFSETASSRALRRGATNIEYIVSVMKRLAESLIHRQGLTVRSLRRLANRRYSIGPNRWIATGVA